MIAEVDSRFSAAPDKIRDLDLEMVRLKLRDEDEGLGWSELQCRLVEVDYKRFLLLKYLYPEKEIVPNKVVDLFWHQHILDTEKYARDCENIFGYFVHHYPYFGMNGASDFQNLQAAFQETCALYQEHFGEEYGSVPTKCRTKCKPMKCK